MLALAAVLPAPAHALDEGGVRIDTVDMTRLEADAGRLWIENAFWPSAETITQKRYSGNVEAEMGKLMGVLKKRLRPECLPADDLLAKNTIAVAGLRKEFQGADGSEKLPPSDYLLLSYTTASGLRIQVQEGAMLYVLVADTAHEACEISEFVSSIAHRVLALPQEESQVFVSTQDVGDSRVGTVLCGRQVGPWQKGWNWYTVINWWSDGKNVLFKLSEKERADFDRVAELMQKQPFPPAPVARRFASRKD